MNSIMRQAVWALLALVGAFALGYIALNRGETISALWIVIAAVCVYLIGYRFYSQYIARKLMELDATRMTPAYRNNDGLTMFRPIKMCCLVTILPQLQVRGHW